MNLQISQAITDIFIDIYQQVWDGDPEAFTPEQNKRVEALEKLVDHCYLQYEIGQEALEIALDVGEKAAKLDRPVYQVDTGDNFLHWFVGTEDEILQKLRAFDGQKCVCSSSLLMSQGCKCGGK